MFAPSPAFSWQARGNRLFLVWRKQQRIVFTTVHLLCAWPHYFPQGFCHSLTDRDHRDQSVRRSVLREDALMCTPAGNLEPACVLTTQCCLLFAVKSLRTDVSRQRAHYETVITSPASYELSGADVPLKPGWTDTFQSKRAHWCHVVEHQHHGKWWLNLKGEFYWLHVEKCAKEIAHVFHTFKWEREK